MVLRGMQNDVKNSCAAPARRRWPSVIRCFHNPRSVSGINIQTSARGSETHIPTGALQLPGDIDVFRQQYRRSRADLMHGGPAKRGDDAGHREQPAESTLRTLDHATMEENSPTCIARATWNDCAPVDCQ